MHALRRFLAKFAETAGEMLNVPLVPPWIGHYAYRIVMAAFVAQIIQYAVVLVFGIPRTLGMLLSIAWLTAVIWCTAGVFDHMRRLCERCISDAPLDAEAKAAKWHRNLRAAHWMSDHGKLFPALIIAAVVFCHVATRFEWVSSEVQGIVFNIPIIWITLSVYRHKRVQVWCPQCRGRGKHEWVPASSPDPAASR